MDWNNFHFAEPYWLWGIVALPILWILYIFFYKVPGSSNNVYKKLRIHIDEHLLKYLLKSNHMIHNEQRKTFFVDLFLWSVIWVMLIFALAGPRYDFKEVTKLSQDKTLVILLDISYSMNASDVKPTRLIHAIQEIEDIIDNNAGTKIGLIVFSADAHIVTPITEDMGSIRYLLKYISSGLSSFNGSRIAEALTMAESMLQSVNGDNKSILIITDGDLNYDIEPPNVLEDLVKRLYENSINIHVMGMGNESGASIVLSDGTVLKYDNKVVISKLEKNFLQNIAKIGRGLYLQPSYFKNDASKILEFLENKNNLNQNEDGEVIKLWNERFYYFIIPILLIILVCFRRGLVFPLIAITLLSSSMIIENAKADNGYVVDVSNAGLFDLFKNDQQIGKEALDRNDFDKAMQYFDDHYARGVVQYKAGDFSGAERSFKEYVDTVTRDIERKVQEQQMSERVVKQQRVRADGKQKDVKNINTEQVNDTKQKVDNININNDEQRNDYTNENNDNFTSKSNRKQGASDSELNKTPEGNAFSTKVSKSDAIVELKDTDAAYHSDYDKDRMLRGLYNLANSQAKQKKFSESVETYQKLLKLNPDHSKAKHNLDLVKKLLDMDREQKKEDKKPNTNGDGTNNEEQKRGGGSSGNGGDSGKDSHDAHDNSRNNDDKTNQSSSDNGAKSSQDANGDGKNQNDKNHKDSDNGNDKNHDKDSHNDDSNNQDNGSESSNVNKNDNKSNESESNNNGKLDSEVEIDNAANSNSPKSNEQRNDDKMDQEQDAQDDKSSRQNNYDNKYDNNKVDNRKNNEGNAKKNMKDIEENKGVDGDIEGNNGKNDRNNNAENNLDNNKKEEDNDSDVSTGVDYNKRDDEKKADNNQNKNIYEEDGQKNAEADQLLRRIKNDPEAFLKNQFRIESLKKSIKPSNKVW